MRDRSERASWSTGLSELLGIQPSPRRLTAEPSLFRREECRLLQFRDHSEAATCLRETQPIGYGSVLLSGKWQHRE
jgi:hypothetical protein